MKKVVMVIITLIAVQQVRAGGNFQTGDNVITAGIGVGGNYGVYSNASGSPGIGLAYELGYWDVGGPGVVSLGGYLGYKSYGFDGSYFGSTYSQKWTYTVIGFRSAYHYNGLDLGEFDPYGGVMLGYNVLKYKYSSSNGLNEVFLNQKTYGSRLALSMYIGGRYYFTNQLGVFAELGYGVSNLTIGGCYKF